VYREQATALVPATVDVTRSLLDLLWPAWPDMRVATRSATLTIPADWTGGNVLVFVETKRGERTALSKVAITPGAAVEVALPSLESDQHVVLVLVASRDPGPPIVLERVLGASAAIVVPPPAPIVPMPPPY
jgi:hypothetical protein